MPQARTGKFPTGANFAVSGALALSPDYYKTKYNFTMPTPWCLDRQLDSFKKVLARIAPGRGKCNGLIVYITSCMLCSLSIPYICADPCCLYFSISNDLLFFVTYGFENLQFT
jgi:hypothetical protein